MPDPSTPSRVALETTLLAHGLPREDALPLADELDAIVRAHGAEPCTIGVLEGRPIADMTRPQLDRLLAEADLPKANTANLGVLMHAGRSAATTVSATMEIAAGAGVRVFATGGIGGVHKNYAAHLDVSADLAALARFPVAVVASGVKSILDVAATREALESLGVPVVGYRTDRFPAFYVRESDQPLDASFDDPAQLASFLSAELLRTGRGVLVCNPIPEADAIEQAEFDRLLAEAESRATADHRNAPSGRDTTPVILGMLREVSDGRTLAANLALVRSNTALAAQLATQLTAQPTTGVTTP